MLRQATEGAKASGEDGIYRGLNNYKDYRAGFRREHTIGAEKGGGSHGPLRASANVRMSVLIDYKPDLCKVGCRAGGGVVVVLLLPGWYFCCCCCCGWPVWCFKLANCTKAAWS